jgi:hypothetical protein
VESAGRDGVDIAAAYVERPAVPPGGGAPGVGVGADAAANAQRIDDRTIHGEITWGLDLTGLIPFQTEAVVDLGDGIRAFYRDTIMTGENVMLMGTPSLRSYSIEDGRDIANFLSGSFATFWGRFVKIYKAYENPDERMANPIAKARVMQTILYENVPQEIKEGAMAYYKFRGDKVDVHLANLERMLNAVKFYKFYENLNELVATQEDNRFRQLIQSREEYRPAPGKDLASCVKDFFVDFLESDGKLTREERRANFSRNLELASPLAKFADRLSMGFIVMMGKGFMSL